MQKTELNTVNCHMAVICATTKPVLCEDHLAEVRIAGNLQTICEETDDPCTACESISICWMEDRYEVDGAIRVSKFVVRLDD